MTNRNFLLYARAQIDCRMPRKRINQTVCNKMETVLSFECWILAKYRMGNQTTTSISFTIASMAELQKKTVPGFLWIHSSSSSVPSTSPLPPLFLSLALLLLHSYVHIWVHTHTHTRTYSLFFHLFFSSSFPAPFELHRFSNISRSRHHYGHQSVERLVGL